MTSLTRRAAAGALSIAALSLALGVATTSTADAASYHYKNCTALHKDFKHGVGKNNATDHHSAGSQAVTNFKKSTKIYNDAIGYNSRLDADHDGIACEAH